MARISNSFAFGSKGYIFAVLLTGLPQLRDQHGLSNGSIVAAVVTVSLMAAVGSRVSGVLAGRWSSRTALRIGLGLTAASAVIVALAPNIIVLFIGFAAYGITTGIINAASNMQQALIQHEYGRFVTASFYATWAVGSILGALFVAAASQLDIALRETMLAAAVIVLIICVVAGPRLLAAPETATTTSAEGTVTTPLRAYLPFGLALALAFAIDLGISNWSALYLTDDLASATSTAALPVAAFQAAALAGLLAGDLWVRRYGPRTVMRASAGLAVLGMTMVVCAPNPVVAIVGFGICGIGLPVITPLCFSEAGRLASGRERDALIARLNMFPYAGTLTGGALVGVIAGLTSLRVGIATLLVFAVILSLIGRAFHTRTATDLPTDSTTDDTPEAVSDLKPAQ